MYTGTQKKNTHFFLQSPQINMASVQFTLSIVSMALCLLYILACPVSLLLHLNPESLDLLS